MISNKFNNCAVVILAAGKGTRMKSDKLKVMHDLKGRPLVDYVVRAVEKLSLAMKPVLVVCDDDPTVQNYLVDRADYVIQYERLGTGHAVAMAKSVLQGKAETVVVLYGDMPFITPESIEKLVIKHQEKHNKITLMTTVVEDFGDWRINLYDYGRIIRGGPENYIVKIVEKKDATEEELKIKELNTAFFCFQSVWLWENLAKLKNDNKQGEYYLTDLVGLAFAEGEKLSSVLVDPREAIGINTLEHLNSAEQIFLNN